MLEGKAILFVIFFGGAWRVVSQVPKQVPGHTGQCKGHSQGSKFRNHFWSSGDCIESWGLSPAWLIVRQVPYSLYHLSGPNSKITWQGLNWGTEAVSGCFYFTFPKGPNASDICMLNTWRKESRGVREPTTGRRCWGFPSICSPGRKSILVELVDVGAHS